MNTPILSVIIPTYNSAPWLHRCLDSVGGQSLNDLEIICVNGASTGESDAILRKHAANDQRVQRIALLQDRGETMALT